MATESTAVEHFAEFVRHFEALPGILTGAADALKADNDAAAVTQEARDREALADILKRYGACNAVTMLSDACYDEYADTDIEDWNTAGTVLGDAANAVNLKYEESERDPRPVAVQDAEDRIQHRCGSSSDYELVRRFA